MKMMARATVTGVTQFAGVIDGETIDANNVFLLIDISATSGKGMRTAARKAMDKGVIDGLLASGVAFPCECDLELMETASRGKETTVITAIKPIAQQRKAA